MKKGIIFALLLVGCKIEDTPNLPSVPPQPHPEVLKERIESIDSKINQYEKKAMEEEIKGMGAFRINYSKFAKEMESSEDSEEKARELEKEKEALIHQ